MTEEEIKEGKVFLLDKPLTWTSFNVVSKVRHQLCRHFGIKKLKVGHAGTLDPLATGLLIVCAGAQTKNISEYQGAEKQYTGTFVVGGRTPSYDLETPVEEGFPFSHITEEKIRQAAASFVGDSMQVPPLFSAIQKDGQRLYEHARAGREVEVDARAVTIYGFEITRIEMPEIDFAVRCSKGTYIRSLAHDFGHALGTECYLSALRRTAIGDFRVEEAISVDQIEGMFPIVKKTVSLDRVEGVLPFAEKANDSYERKKDRLKG